jgi:hypothetical protein
MSTMLGKLRYPPFDADELPKWVEWLWGFGCDTYEMAEILEIPEADAERILHEVMGRSH